MGLLSWVFCLGSFVLGLLSFCVGRSVLRYQLGPKMLRGKAMDEETRMVRFRGLAAYAFAFVFVVEICL